MDFWNSSWNTLGQTFWEDKGKPMENFTSILWEARDKKVDAFPLMNTPSIPIILSLLYVLTCVVFAPGWMRNRKAYDLRNSIIVFNLFLIVVNLYLHYKIWSLAWGNNYNWACQPFDKTLNSMNLKIAQTIWLYYICKYVDWIDTLFFILRKKFSHVSSLHLYHHATMPINSWLLVRYMPGGSPTFFVYLNTAVHVIMHLYYCLAALGPKYQKYLWWKRYLTLLQLVQFTAVFVQGILAITIFGCSFDLPIEFKYYFFFQVAIIFGLFAKFYLQTYSVKIKRR